MRKRKLNTQDIVDKIIIYDLLGEFSSTKEMLKWISKLNKLQIKNILSLNIDKKRPKLSIRKSHDHIIITASDNVSLDKVGYSVDGQNFDYEEIDKVKKSTFSKEYNYYRYVCIVDSAGNVSKIKKIISE